MKASLSTCAMLAAIGAAAVAGSLFHYLPTFASAAKTLRCEMTITSTHSFVWKGAVQTIPWPPQNLTVIWRRPLDRPLGQRHVWRTNGAEIQC
jgi:hypothetical protein